MSGSWGRQVRFGRGRIAGALLLAALVAAESLAAQDAGVAEVQAAERARFAAQVARDTAALGRLLADEMRYTHSNALIESKAHFIETVATGRIIYDDISPGEMTHRVYGNTAVGSGTVRVRVEMNGRTITVDLLFLTVHVRRAGRWELVAWQSTKAQ